MQYPSIFAWYNKMRIQRRQSLREEVTFKVDLAHKRVDKRIRVQSLRNSHKAGILSNQPSRL